MTSRTRGGRHVRTWSGATLAVVGLLVLSGCMKLDMDVTLSEDDTASGTLVFAFSDEVAESMGMEPQELWEQGSGELSDELPERATEEPYSDGEYTGAKYTMPDEPIDEFSGGGVEDLSITREGDEYVVAGVMDLTDQAGDLADVPQDVLDSFAVRLAVTFPGEVVASNGEVVGANTVEWHPQLGERTEIQARGSAVANGGAAEPGDEAAADETRDDAATSAADDGFPWWIVGALVGVVVLAVVVVLVARANRPTPGARVDGDANRDHPIFPTGPPPGPRHDEHPVPPPPPDRPTTGSGGTR